MRIKIVLGLTSFLLFAGATFATPTDPFPRGLNLGVCVPVGLFCPDKGTLTLNSTLTVGQAVFASGFSLSYNAGTLSSSSVTIEEPFGGPGPVDVVTDFYEGGTLSFEGHGLDFTSVLTNAESMTTVCPDAPNGCSEGPNVFFSANFGIPGDPHIAQIAVGVGPLGVDGLTSSIGIDDSTPEPGTLSLLGLGMVGLIVARRRMVSVAGNMGMGCTDT